VFVLAGFSVGARASEIVVLRRRVLLACGGRSIHKVAHMARAATPKAKDTSAKLEFEAKLWLAADKLRSNIDAAEHKHVVLGVIFLKHISDTFEELESWCTVHLSDRENIAHCSEPRFMIERECARLQTFSDRFEFNRLYTTDA
jgi:type I restriction-modification system DNA methylase subunit